MKLIDRTIDTLYPEGLRGLGVVTLIAIMATFISPLGLLTGMPLLAIGLVAGVAYVLIVISVIVVALARAHHRIALLVLAALLVSLGAITFLIIRVPPVS